MAQYMFLIYDDQKAWQSFTEEERKAGMAQYFAFTDEARRAGERRLQEVS